MAFPQIGTDEWPFIIGHRGGAGPAYENSLAAFRNAAGSGDARCDGVELDIHVSADGAFVVHHDPILGSGGVIGKLPLATLRKELLPDGSAIPTLQEVLTVIGNLSAFVEVKDLPEQHDERLLSLIATAARPERCHVHSFDHRIVSRLKRKSPGLSTGVLSSSYPIDPVEQVRQAGAGTLWQSWELIDRALILACAGEGISLIAWTVDSAEQARHLIALGVTMLCGNWPDRLRQPLSKG
jgi:glycerophosphoryl diester phosphodiesterase